MIVPVFIFRSPYIVSRIHSFQNGTWPVEVTGKNFSKQQAGGSNHTFLLPFGSAYKDAGQEANSHFQPQVGHNGQSMYWRV